MLPHYTKLTKYIFLVFIIILLAYAYFEAQKVLFGPEIHLGNKSITTVYDQKIKISGNVKNVTTLILDGRPLLIDDTGNFMETILLIKGINMFTFSAKDKFGNVTKNTMRVFYQPRATLQQTKK